MDTSDSQSTTTFDFSTLYKSKMDGTFTNQNKSILIINIRFKIMGFLSHN